MTVPIRDVIQVSASDTHCIATWRNVLVAVWREVPDPSRVAEVQRALSQLATRQGSVCVVILLEQGAGIPSAETRSAAAGLMRSSGDHVVGWAVVIEGGGILRPTIRSVAVAAKLIARTKFPLQICATADEAAQWLAGLPAAEGCAQGQLDQLPSVVSQVRASLTQAA